MMSIWMAFALLLTVMLEVDLGYGPQVLPRSCWPTGTWRGINR